MNITARVLNKNVNGNVTLHINLFIFIQAISSKKWLLTYIHKKECIVKYKHTSIALHITSNNEEYSEFGNNLEWLWLIIISLVLLKKAAAHVLVI